MGAGYVLLSSTLPYPPLSSPSLLYLLEVRSPASGLKLSRS